MNDNPLILSRRGFVTGLVGLVAAPAIVRASSLMRVKQWKELETTKLAIQPSLSGDFDVFVWNDNGLIRFSRGPAWGKTVDGAPVPRQLPEGATYVGTINPSQDLSYGEPYQIGAKLKLEGLKP
jgi:hypothetical protein